MWRFDCAQINLVDRGEDVFPQGGGNVDREFPCSEGFFVIVSIIGDKFRGWVGGNCRVDSGVGWVVP